MTNRSVILIGFSSLASSQRQPRLSAHHGATNVYDFSKPVVMKGTITKFEWLNPHNQIYFDVTDEKGVVYAWIAATEPPQVMLERGWTRRSLKEGDEVTVYIFAAKNGAKVGNLQKIVLADGKELTAAGPAPAPGCSVEIDDSCEEFSHAKSDDVPGDLSLGIVTFTLVASAQAPAGSAAPQSQPASSKPADLAGDWAPDGRVVASVRA